MGHALICLARAFPVAAWMGLAEVVGTITYALMPRRRAVAIENLRLAFGDRFSAAQRRRIVRRAFVHVGRVVTELLLSQERQGSAAWRARHIHFYGPWDELAAESREGRSGIVVSAHLGNWEAGGFLMAERGVPWSVVAREMDFAWAQKIVEAQRGGTTHMIWKKGAARGVLRALRAGRTVGLLGDQNAGRHGLFVPFFGVPASTLPLPVTLARRLERPLYVAACLRRPGGGLLALLARVASPPPELVGEAAERWQLARIHGWHERWIRAHPEQYNWFHRRWKTRPDDEAPGPRTPFYGRPLHWRRRTASPAGGGATLAGVTPEGQV